MCLGIPMQIVDIDGYNARVEEANRKGETVVRTVQTGFDRESGEPVYEQDFLDCSYGFRPGRSVAGALDAAVRALGHTRAGQPPLTHAYALDVADCFDSLDHAVLRQRYAAHLRAIVPAKIKALLVTMDYPQAEMQGPPFSVTSEEVTALYRDYAEVRLLAQLDVLAKNPRFRERGLTRLQECIFLLTLR